MKMEEVPMHDNGKADTNVSVVKKEVVRTLGALVADYVSLISERQKADDLYFNESVPQPSEFRKSDRHSFYESDCEKVISGNCTIDGKPIGTTNSDCVDVTYDKPQKEIISKPTKYEITEPVKQKFEEPAFMKKPVMTALSAISLALLIGMLIWGISGAYVAFLLVGVCVAAVIGFTLYSRGGVFAAIIYLIKLPKIKAERKKIMEDYHRRVNNYEQRKKEAQEEYNQNVADYERQVVEADKEYERKCNELYESILKSVNEYAMICKEYFKRKQESEAENDKQKAVIKKNYIAIAKKIEAYPDIIPTKYLKVPAFEQSSCYGLRNVRNELKAYIDILESGRADTLKEATNCYIEDQHRRAVEEQAEEQRRQAEEQTRILEEQAEEQTRILEKQAEEQERAQSDKDYCVRYRCPDCKANCYGMGLYTPNGRGGCRNFKW